MLHKHITKSAFAPNGYRGLLALLMVVGLASLSASCAQSEAEITMAGPKVISCKTDQGVLTVDKVEADKTLPDLQIYLGDYDLCKGFPVALWDDGGTTKVIVAPSFPLSWNVVNNLKSTTSLASIGAGPELRIDQNGFTPKTISYKILDNKLGVEISDKAAPNFVIQSGTNGTLSSIPFLNNEDIKKLKAKFTTTGQSATIRVSAQMSGILAGGKSISSTPAVFTLTIKNQTSGQLDTVCAPVATGFQAGKLGTLICPVGK